MSKPASMHVANSTTSTRATPINDDVINHYDLCKINAMLRPLKRLLFQRFRLVIIALLMQSSIVALVKYQQLEGKGVRHGRLTPFPEPFISSHRPTDSEAS